MASEKDQSQKPQRFDDPDVAEFYSNVVMANVTPLEFNLVFGRAGVPISAPPRQEVDWTEHVNYFARVALPLPLLPLVIRLLEQQLEVAVKTGIIHKPTVRQETAGEVKP